MENLVLNYLQSITVSEWKSSSHEKENEQKYTVIPHFQGLTLWHPQVYKFLWVSLSVYEFSVYEHSPRMN